MHRNRKPLKAVDSNLISCRLPLDRLSGTSQSINLGTTFKTPKTTNCKITAKETKLKSSRLLSSSKKKLQNKLQKRHDGHNAAPTTSNSGRDGIADVTNTIQSHASKTNSANKRHNVVELVNSSRVPNMTRSELDKIMWPFKKRSPVTKRAPTLTTSRTPSPRSNNEKFSPIKGTIQKKTLNDDGSPNLLRHSKCNLLGLPSTSNNSNCKISELNRTTKKVSSNKIESKAPWGFPMRSQSPFKHSVLSPLPCEILTPVLFSPFVGHRQLQTPAVPSIISKSWLKQVRDAPVDNAQVLQAMLAGPISKKTKFKGPLTGMTIGGSGLTISHSVDGSQLTQCTQEEYSQVQKLNQSEQQQPSKLKKEPDRSRVNAKTWSLHSDGKNIVKTIYFEIDGERYQHVPLPPGWSLRISRSKKKPYYAHPEYGATWFCPVPLPVKSPVYGKAAGEDHSKTSSKKMPAPGITSPCLETNASGCRNEGDTLDCSKHTSDTDGIPKKSNNLDENESPVIIANGDTKDCVIPIAQSTSDEKIAAAQLLSLSVTKKTHFSVSNECSNIESTKNAESDPHSHFSRASSHSTAEKEDLIEAADAIPVNSPSSAYSLPCSRKLPRCECNTSSSPGRDRRGNKSEDIRLVSSPLRTNTKRSSTMLSTFVESFAKQTKERTGTSDAIDRENMELVGVCSLKSSDKRGDPAQIVKAKLSYGHTSRALPKWRQTGVATLALMESPRCSNTRKSIILDTKKGVVGEAMKNVESNSSALHVTRSECHKTDPNTSPDARNETNGTEMSICSSNSAAVMSTCCPTDETDATSSPAAKNTVYQAGLKSLGSEEMAPRGSPSPCESRSPSVADSGSGGSVTNQEPGKVKYSRSVKYVASRQDYCSAEEKSEQSKSTPQMECMTHAESCGVLLVKTARSTSTTTRKRSRRSYGTELLDSSQYVTIPCDITSAKSAKSTSVTTHKSLRDKHCYDTGTEESTRSTPFDKSIKSVSSYDISLEKSLRSASITTQKSSISTGHHDTARGNSILSVSTRCGKSMRSVPSYDVSLSTCQCPTSQAPTSISTQETVRSDVRGLGSCKGSLGTSYDEYERTARTIGSDEVRQVESTGPRAIKSRKSRRSNSNKNLIQKECISTGGMPTEKKLRSLQSQDSVNHESSRSENVASGQSMRLEQKSCSPQGGFTNSDSLSERNLGSQLQPTRSVSTSHNETLRPARVQDASKDEFETQFPEPHSSCEESVSGREMLNLKIGRHWDKQSISSCSDRPFSGSKIYKNVQNEAKSRIQNPPHKLCSLQNIDALVLNTGKNHEQVKKKRKTMKQKKLLARKKAKLRRNKKNVKVKIRGKDSGSDSRLMSRAISCIRRRR